MTEPRPQRILEPDDELLSEIDAVIMRAYGFASRISRITRFLEVENGGWTVLRVDGRVVATGGFIAYPTGGFGWVGLIATDPRSQRRGYARVVTQALVDDLQELGCASVLDASAAGAPVYERMGFTDHGLSTLFTGPPSSPADRGELPDVPGLGVFPIPAHDAALFSETARYDAAAFGADRSALLRHIVTAHPGRSIAVRNEGRIVGYGIAQDDAIGPVVADDAVVARIIVGALTGLAWSEPPRLIVPPESAFHHVVGSLGFQRQRVLRRQHLGIGPLPGNRRLLCAQASFGEG